MGVLHMPTAAGHHPLKSCPRHEAPPHDNTEKRYTFTLTTDPPTPAPTLRLTVQRIRVQAQTRLSLVSAVRSRNCDLCTPGRRGPGRLFRLFRRRRRATKRTTPAARLFVPSLRRARHAHMYCVAAHTYSCNTHRARATARSSIILTSAHAPPCASMRPAPGTTNSADQRGSGRSRNADVCVRLTATLDSGTYNTCHHRLCDGPYKHPTRYARAAVWPQPRHRDGSGLAPSPAPTRARRHVAVAAPASRTVARGRGRRLMLGWPRLSGGRFCRCHACPKRDAWAACRGCAGRSRWRGP